MENAVDTGARRRLPSLIKVHDVVFSLVCGMLITVLVGWMFALNAEPTDVTPMPLARWPAAAPASWPPTSRITTKFALRHASAGIEQYDSWGGNDKADLGAHHMRVVRVGWPRLALESVLVREQPRNTYWDNAGSWENEPSLAAGLIVPLVQSRPLASSDHVWATRRLPMRVMTGGFAVNSAIASGMTLALTLLWRLRSSLLHTPRWQHPVALMACGFGINLLVAWGVWGVWQLQPPVRQLTVMADSRYHTVAFVQGRAAIWPIAPPASWPDRPIAGRELGEAFGVRAYEMLSRWEEFKRGEPRSGRDLHQKMNIVQVGWPFPTLQSEELIEVPEGVGSIGGPAWSERRQLSRRSATWTITLPGAGAPVVAEESTAIVPIRPILLGTLTNTLLYGVGLCVLVWTPGATRAIRYRQGRRCPACGYDLQQIAVCPECGRSNPYRPGMTPLATPPSA